MNSADLTYGDATEVARYLMGAEGVTLDELHSALINALVRIAALEASRNPPASGQTK